MLAGGAKLVSCAGCSGASEVGYIGCSNGGTLTFPSVSSTADGKTTIRVHYTNGDTSQRYANVIVNGASQVLAFVPTDGDRAPKTSVLTAYLKSGTNSIRFEGYNGGCGKSPLSAFCFIVLMKCSTKHRPAYGTSIVRLYSIYSILPLGTVGSYLYLIISMS